VQNAFEVLVVGGGHAGCEAAAAAARCGARVALVTHNREHIGRLSCNPAVGGLAKGHLVKEIDALGGLMAKVADATTIQFRRLNTRRGLAVQSSRAQVDIDRYPLEMQRRLALLPMLEIVEGEVVDLIVKGGRVEGVQLEEGSLYAPRVILATGTFLAAVMHTGPDREEGGRTGERSANRLAHTLRELGLRVGRLKTGTVPRLDGRTIAWERTAVQGDTIVGAQFSFEPRSAPSLPQIECHVTYTNHRVHQIIRRDMHLSPMRTGAIEGRGPRYCPSIEDKVARFPDRDRHLLFLEPEGLATDRVYVNGISTSLPRRTQTEFIRCIEGLEDARILQYGYAVEYDFADPRQLDHGLQHRDISGLYLAGQVNGTSGYEEAAAQGLVAGVSAARGEPLRLGRDRAYIGVLIDDLVSRGVGGEPYRMFTSRAEHRLLLREDNADRRLMAIARQHGLITDATWERRASRQAEISRVRELLECAINPTPRVVAFMKNHELGTLRSPTTGSGILRRPRATFDTVWKLVGSNLKVDPVVAEQVEIDVKYEGYILRASRRARADARMERAAIPPGVDWNRVQGISSEVRERLQEAQPSSIGQAARLPGVTPAAISAITTWLVRTERSGDQ